MRVSLLFCCCCCCLFIYSFTKSVPVSSTGEEGNRVVKWSVLHTADRTLTHWPSNNSYNTHLGQGQKLSPFKPTGMTAPNVCFDSAHYDEIPVCVFCLMPSHTLKQTFSPRLSCFLVFAFSFECDFFLSIFIFSLFLYFLPPNTNTQPRC